MNVVMTLISLLSGKALSDAQKAALPAELGIEMTILADREQMEFAFEGLAKAALVPGVQVLEIAGQPKLLNGKKVRLLAVIG